MFIVIIFFDWRFLWVHSTSPVSISLARAVHRALNCVHTFLYASRLIPAIFNVFIYHLEINALVDMVRELLHLAYLRYPQNQSLLHILPLRFREWGNQFRGFIVASRRWLLVTFTCNHHRSLNLVRIHVRSRDWNCS